MSGFETPDGKPQDIEATDTSATGSKLNGKHPVQATSDNGASPLAVEIPRPEPFAALQDHRPGFVPAVLRHHDLVIRAYQPDDDPYLMELERLCPRGEPRPFYHFRRRFIDRALLYSRPYMFIAEKEGRPVGVTTVAIKDTHINGEPLQVCYSFDTRVHPKYRRLGIANAMQEEKIAFLRSQGVHLLHTYVVATNVASIKMLEKVGFKKNRQILDLTFPPYPLIIPPLTAPEQATEPGDDKVVEQTFGQRDLFVRDVTHHLAPFNYKCFSINVGGNIAFLSVFDQSLVYQKVSADEPMPTEAEVLQRARVWRIFNEVGTKHPNELRILFDHMRDLAVSANVARLTWLIDRADPVPGFVFAEASTQTDYWMMSRPLIADWEPQWQNAPVYLDPRDL